MNISNDTDRTPEDGARPLPGGRLHPLPAGWTLDCAARFEAARPGFLMAAMRARGHWRQAVWASFAHGLLDRVEPFLEKVTGEPVGDDRPWSAIVHEVADVLPTLGPRQIVDAAIGTAPHGYLGALKKLAYAPLTAEGYRRLHRLFSANDAASRERSRVVEQMGSLDGDRLEAAEVLDLAILTPSVLAKISDRRQAERLNERVQIVRSLCSTANDRTLRKSVQDAGVEVDLNAWFRNWTARADRLPAIDLPTDPEIEVVTGANVREVAKRFRNCLASHKLGHMISGCWVAVEFKPCSAIVTLSRLTNGSWLVSGVFGVGNRTVSPGVTERVRTKFTAMGCLMVERTPEHLRAAVSAFAPFGLDEFEFEDFGGL